MNNRTIKKQQFTWAAADITANAWQTLKAFRELGKSGRITRVVTHFTAGTGAAGAIVRVINGQYTTDYAVADIGAIPDHDVALHRSGITLAPDASVASDDYNVEGVSGGAFYSAVQQLRSDSKTRTKDEPLISVFAPTGVTGGDIIVTVYSEVRK
jgi:hypothetical protein